MKLASYRDGSRDGQLIVVSTDLSTAHYATGIATRLQQVLDDWNFLSPQLETLAQTLDHGKARHAFPFDPRLCLAPLPRAFLLAEPAPCDPMALRLDRGDHCLGPAGNLALDDGRDEATLAVQAAAITGDIAAGASPGEALEGVRLITVMAAVDGAPPGDRAWVFAPVAVTPDVLGDAWHAGRARLGLRALGAGTKTEANALHGDPRAGFGEWLAVLAGRQGLRAGSIVGAGHGPERGDGPRGRRGTRLRIELLNGAGQPCFGCLEPVIGRTGNTPEDTPEDTPEGPPASTPEAPKDAQAEHRPPGAAEPTALG